MKPITLIAAFLVASFSVANAENSDSIQTLPPQVIQYGSFPTAVEQPVPVLPAAIASEDGYVLVRFDIAESGRVSNIEVLEASDDKMAKFSRAMVRRWSFDNPGESITAMQPIVFEAGAHMPMLLAAR